MNNEKYYITINGKKKLKAELKKLIEEIMPQLLRERQEARALGDTSENAEYHEAIKASTRAEKRINELQILLKNCVEVDVNKIRGDCILFGTTVELENMNNEEKLKFTIVGTTEVNVEKGFYSIDAPLVQACLGKKKGEIATFFSGEENKKTKFIYKILDHKILPEMFA